jgi:uncharacterized membrane protein
VDAIRRVPLVHGGGGERQAGRRHASPLKADIGGIKREWDATTTEQTPDQRIAWKATDGTANAGVVTFHRLDEKKTRVMLQITIDGDDLIERLGERLGVIESQIEADMDRFKEMMESRGAETGAWRGDVSQSATS